MRLVTILDCGTRMKIILNTMISRVQWATVTKEIMKVPKCALMVEKAGSLDGIWIKASVLI